MNRVLELLAPVKNYEYGVEAVKCGADALYIGASSFGARSAAGNSVEEISRLVEYAHPFGVKVYVTVNTLLYDEELAAAEELIWELYRAGVDALIVQDMGICRMNLPAIELHASTQAAALTPQRVRFLEEVGFDRVVLERAMSLDEIRAIRAVSAVELEAFVFGAICVSYSGQCYLSHEVAARSGNRGVCAQPCRSRYDLTDENGAIVLRGAHLLSLKDLNLEAQLGELIASGVMSFKIEGRLKDIAYLKNSVSYYNGLLNREIKRLNDLGEAYRRSSEGHCGGEFDPAPSRTFNRGFTSYFVGGETVKMANFESAKPIGGMFAKVLREEKGAIVLDRKVTAIPGDGLCFVNAEGVLCGAYLNKIEGDRILLSNSDSVVAGATLYRNYDKAFSDQVERSRSRRVVAVEVEVCFSEEKVTATAKETYGECAEVEFPNRFERPNDPARALEAVQSAFSKTGDTMFEVQCVNVSGEVRFVPIKMLNEMRRMLFAELLRLRVARYVPRQRTREIATPLCDKTISYKANVTNRLAREFYSLCGAEQIEEGIELSQADDRTELMRMKYCVRREIGVCLKNGGKYRELYIENNNRRFKLNFDCRNCEMYITKG